MYIYSYIKLYIVIHIKIYSCIWLYIAAICKYMARSEYDVARALTLLFSNVKTLRNTYVAAAKTNSKLDSLTGTLM